MRRWEDPADRARGAGYTLDARRLVRWLAWGLAATLVATAVLRWTTTQGGVL